MYDEQCGTCMNHKGISCKLVVSVHAKKSVLHAFMCLCWNLKSLFVRDSEQEGDTVMRSWCKCNDETGGVGLFSLSVCVCVAREYRAGTDT